MSSSPFPLKEHKKWASMLPFLKPGERLKFICKLKDGNKYCEVSKESLSDSVSDSNSTTYDLSMSRSDDPW